MGQDGTSRHFATLVAGMHTSGKEWVEAVLDLATSCTRGSGQNSACSQGYMVHVVSSLLPKTEQWLQVPAGRSFEALGQEA